MPSPQALVAFSLSLFLLLVLLRATLGFGPNVAATIAILVSLVVGYAVERMIPPELDDEDDLSVDEEANDEIATGQEESR
jgi:hypothetical protein